MRRFLILSLLLVVMLVLLMAGAGFAMSETAVFQPGDLLFPVQRFVENQRTSVITDPVQQSHYRIDLVEQRLVDLGALLGTPDEEQAVEALFDALRNVVAALAQVPEDALPALKSRLAELLAETSELETSLQPGAYQDEELAHEFAAFISSLEGMMGDPISSQSDTETGDLLSASGRQDETPLTGQQEPPSNSSSNIEPVVVEFPEGSLGAEHEFFVLSGKHLELSCEKCHTEGKYAGIPDLCVDCHETDRPDPHFDFECDTCHNPDGWEFISFDHSLSIAVDCQSCHLSVRPVNHYSGQCSACHITTAWIPASFNHKAVNATNCLNCHSGVKPTNHYSGQCSSCHSTSAWRPATFNHKAVNATNCQNCHSGVRPTNHYSGQCSSCHNTSAWRPATFNHKAANATDCQGCHKRPGGHSGGQCSACHSTSGWRPASFDHKTAGATDCQGCHKRPSGHSSGQCSSCHSTSGWRPANFDHKAAGATDCQGCHQRPSGHSSGQCSNCHNTSRWGDVDVKNSFLPNQPWECQRRMLKVPHRRNE